MQEIDFSNLVADQSAAAFIKAMKQLDLDWKNTLPEDAQIVFYILLSGGGMLEIGHVTEEGYNGLRIQGRDEQGEIYVLIVHQATVQIMCKVLKITPEHPRRPIGFGPHPPGPQETEAS